MADQKVSLKIGADVSEIEKAFGALIQKIQGQADKLRLSPASTSSRGGAAQTARDQERSLTREKALLDMYNRSLESRRKILEDITKLEAKGVDQTRQRQIAEERLGHSRQIAAIQQTNYERAQEAARRSMGGSGGGSGAGGFKMPAGGITNLSGLAGLLGAPGIAAAGIAATGAAAIAAIESARRFFVEAPLKTRETEASAFQMQGQGGQRLQAFLNGGAANELTFNPQRALAAQTAQGAIAGRYTATPVGGAMGLGLQGLMGSQAFGALEHGSIMQAIRATGGHLGIESLQRQFEANKQLETATLQASQFEALKKGPEGAIRTAIADKYLQNYQRDLDFQRQMGLNTQTFRGPGGFLPGVQSAGFTGEQGMGMASGILGAGGSTRSAVGNAALALQAQRNLDMTNAGSILGKLSGGLGGAGTTGDAFVKLLAEGTRVGLDGSEFREENRKFVESAADVITKSGVTTAGGVEQILSQFGRFFGDRTMTGIEAGKGAFELYRQTSMATTGPRATMRAAGMLTNPTISRLDRYSREALFNMPIDQLTSDNPAIMAMAAQVGVTPEELISAQNKITSQSANLFKRSDIARDRLTALKKKYGVTSALNIQSLPQSAQAEINKALGESNISQIMEHPELGQNQRMASEYSDALSAGDAQRQSKALEDAKKQQIQAPTTGRPEDETNRIQAEASRLANQLFMSIKDSIVPASDAAKNFAADINALTAAMRGANPAAAAAALQKFQSNYPGIINQPSAGSPSNGPGAH